VSAKQNAINALKSNRTVVLGPPGTGKTTTMMEVIGLLLADGYRPEDIAFVSFSKKAVNEAKERAIKRFDLDDESLRNFRTLHSTSWKLTKPGDPMKKHHWGKFMEATKYRVSAEDDVDEDGDNLAQSYFDTEDDKYKEALAWSRNTLSSMQTAAGKWGVTEAGLRAYEMAYRGFRELHGLADYPAGLEKMREGRYVIACRVLIVDEAQDLSPLQQEALGWTIEAAEKVIIAGDDDQAIYEFQGADQRWLISLAQRSDWSTVVLSQSYRLRREPWTYAMQFTTAMKQRAAKEYLPRVDDSDGKVVQRCHASVALDRVIQLALDERERRRTAAWLTRRRKGLENPQQELLRACVPFVSQHGKLETNPLRKDKEGVCMLRQVVHAARDLGLDKPVAIEDLLALVESGVRLRRESKGDPAPRFGHAKLKQQVLALKKSLKATVTATELLGMPEIDCRALIDGIRTHGPIEVLDKLGKGVQAYAQGLWQEFGCIPEPRITMTSIHQSKGGEWDVVVLDLSTSKWLETQLALQGQQESEKRIAYVGATRSRDELYVLPIEVVHKEQVVGHRSYLTARSKRSL
jgi:DNA helicase-2/ATP-dependent DNA helicase PcrA